MGITKLITVLTPTISKPLAATSVAMRMSICSSLNFFSDSKRCCCVKLPCSSPALMPNNPNKICSLWACFFVWTKTIQWSWKVRHIKLAKIGSRSPSLSSRIRMNSWRKLKATCWLLLTKTFTGLFRETAAKSFTFSLMVAEKSIVCLVFEQELMISFICSAKYSSNIRSASSRIRTLISEYKLFQSYECLYEFSLKCNYGCFSEHILPH